MNIGDSFEGVAFETVVQRIVAGILNGPDVVVDGRRHGAQANAQRHQQTQPHSLPVLRGNGVVAVTG